MPDCLDIDSVAPLTLAFVGDAVFTLFVRSALVNNHGFKSGELTRRAAKIVSAVSQSRILGVLCAELSDDELDIVRRCRNAHSANTAKNASVGQYHRATGLEGLLGFMHLKGDRRLEMVLNRCLEIYNQLD